MRRGRGKGKKQNESTHEDHESGEEEEKIPTYRRRGRPQKPVGDDFKEEEEDDESSITSKDLKEKKRKMPLQSNGETVNISEEERLKSSIDDSTKSISIGYRLNGNRRKSKPRRAAEAVVECDQV